MPVSLFFYYSLSSNPMKTIWLTFLAHIFCAFLLCSGLAQGQSVTINSISGTSFCDGDSISVTFTATGFWGHRNAFTLQLSDPNGSFSNNFQNLGSIVDTLPGTFTINTITLGNGGSHYRFRILAAIPYTISADNGSDIAIGTKAYVTLGSHIAVGSVGTPITFANWIGSDTVFWDFGSGATPATASSAGIVTIAFDPYIGKNDTSVSFPPQDVTYLTPGDKVITLTAVNPGGCSTTLTYKLHIYDCTNPTIPHDAIVVNSDTIVTGQDHNLTYWVNPGVSLYLSGGLDTIFAEPGSTISHADYCILYMKPGSVFKTEYDGTNSVIYGDGASINASSTDFILHCPALDFDYTNAPPNAAHPLDGVVNTSLPSVTISPNPTSGIISIQGAPPDDLNISVLNLLGETMVQLKNPQTPNFTLDLSKLAAGTYYIRFSSANSVATKKIIKN
jgi:hypothetical protein